METLTSYKKHTMPRLIKEKELPAISKLTISELPREEIDTLCANLIHTTIHLFGRVNQNSTNTDLSSSSDKGRQKKQPNPNAPASKEHNRADVRKKRAKGVVRTQILKTTTEEAIKPDSCTDCHTPFLVSTLACYTAFYQIELVKINDEGYYRVVQTKYSLYEGHCPTCDTTTRATIAAYSMESNHKTISRQGIIGPTLAAEIIAFHKENGTSTRKIRKTIERLYGITLSDGAIIEAINNGGLYCEPTVETYRVDATQADLANMDETTWRNASKRLWLWVVITHNAMGRRTKEMAHIKALCEAHQDSPHDKAKALAREFRNDWDAIFRILEYLHYPLTNNKAERVLRHWVILRTCAIASMIATGKRRGQDFVKNIKGCIKTAKGVLNHISYKPLRLSG